ncbi:hypothetical protein FQR65_LT16536 [Abscondita terminalis]|nr:hypothetical protein FQR65_LT16536 [Abscondita terminalis]
MVLLMDNGPAVTLVKHHIVDPNLIQKEPDVFLTGIAGTPLKALGSSVFLKMFQILFLTCRDWLIANKAVIDYENCMLNIWNQSIPILHQSHLKIGEFRNHIQRQNGENKYPLPSTNYNDKSETINRENLENSNCNSSKQEKRSARNTSVRQPQEQDTLFREDPITPLVENISANSLGLRRTQLADHNGYIEQIVEESGLTPLSANLKEISFEEFSSHLSTPLNTESQRLKNEKKLSEDESEEEDFVKQFCERQKIYKANKATEEIIKNAQSCPNPKETNWKGNSETQNYCKTQTLKIRKTQEVDIENFAPLQTIVEKSNLNNKKETEYSIQLLEDTILPPRVELNCNVVNMNCSRINNKQILLEPVPVGNQGVLAARTLTQNVRELSVRIVNLNNHSIRLPKNTRVAIAEEVNSFYDIKENKKNRLTGVNKIEKLNEEWIEQNFSLSHLDDNARGNKEVEWEALVVNNSKLEAIIGMNLINKYKIKIDAENKTLRYGDEVIKWVQWKEEKEGINVNNARLIKNIEENEVQTNNVGDQEQVKFIKELVQKTQKITDETPLKQNTEHPENEINILQQSEERIMVSRLKMKSEDMFEKRLKQIKENTYTAQDHKKTKKYNNEKAKHENNGKIETKGLIIEQIWKELDKIKVLENDIEKNEGDSEYEDKRRKKRRTHSEEDSIKCKLK